MGRGGAAGLALHSLCSGTWNTARRQLHVIKIHSVEVVVEATELAAIPPREGVFTEKNLEDHQSSHR